MGVGMTEQNHIRDLIAQLGLSQREVARRLRINENQFRRYLLPPERSSARKPPHLLRLVLEAWVAGYEPKEN